MIIVDIETSGVDFVKNGIWQIGAVDLENPENQFLEEGRIDDDDEIDEIALEITGKREEYIRDSLKRSQKDLIVSFFNWCEGVGGKMCGAQNPQFDLGFLFTKSRKYGLDIPIHYRAIDLHSIATLKHFQVFKKMLIKNGRSDMGLTNILKFCGMEDNRTAHNALEDAKLAAECFNRIIYGKTLFSEYLEFFIPEYLEDCICKNKSEYVLGKREPEAFDGSDDDGGENDDENLDFEPEEEIL